MSGVQLRFLGTGDAFGSGGRLHTSTFVRSAEGDLLVDCGPSTLAAMRRGALDPNAVDAIVLTARISALNTARIRLHNISGSPVDPPSCTYRVIVRKRIG